MILNDPYRNTQTETRALFLGAEKGLKHAIPDRLRDPGTVVTYFDYGHAANRFLSDEQIFGDDPGVV